MPGAAGAGENGGVLLSEDAAGRVQRVDQDYLTVRVGALAALPGNPDGAALRQFGHGYGAQAIRQVATLIKDHGATELLTSYTPGHGSPAGFYARLGFVPTGHLDSNGEIITALALP